MDVFARALIIADKILNESDFSKIRAERYASFASGKGKDFDSDKLTLEDMYKIAKEVGEPKQISGKQEMLEQLINCYI